MFRLTKGPSALRGCVPRRDRHDRRALGRFLLSLPLGLLGQFQPLARHLGKALLDLRVAGFLFLLLALGSFGSVGRRRTAP
jgi:hypothetical protein